jgi:hypothetical protein
MGNNLISRKFVSTNRIATKHLEVSISLKMSIKGSRSTINYKVKPLIQNGSELCEIPEALLLSLENYNLCLEMPYLNYY